MRVSLQTLLLAGLLSATVANAVEQFGYRVVDKKPQDRTNYVQGLQIVDDQLYVSTGWNGQSKLLRYNFDDMSLERMVQLPRIAFGEGLTVLGDRVYQLTWKNRALLVYNKADFSRLEIFQIPGEGYGLTSNGSQLIYSDGTDKLHFMNPDNGFISHSVQVTENGHAISQINELEWIDGQVWANIWRTDRIVKIDPVNGKITASIDLSGLRPRETLRDANQVLNGIARDPRDGSLWVTGKRWPWLFQIELVPQENDQPTQTEAKKR